MEQNNHIRGMNMYLDDNNQDIYYDFISKNGYLINEKKRRRFNMYKNRYIMVFVGAVLAVNYFFTVEITIILALAALAALEYFFRFRFLRSCTTYPNFKRGRKAVFETHENRGKEILRIVLYLAFAVLIVVNAYVSELDTIMVALSYVASAIALWAAVRSVGYLRK